MPTYPSLTHNLPTAERVCVSSRALAEITKKDYNLKPETGVITKANTKLNEKFTIKLYTHIDLH
jgi:hypothetical protein